MNDFACGVSVGGIAMAFALAVLCWATKPAKRKYECRYCDAAYQTGGYVPCLHCAAKGKKFPPHGIGGTFVSRGGP